MGDQQTINVYDNQSAEYAKLVKQNKPSPELLAFIGLIRPGGHVLDLGCGPAMDSAHMRDCGLSVDPVDASDEMVKLANDTYAIGARTARFEDITQSDIYDGVWANFSLLHASADAFPTILKSLYTATRSGGWIHLGMKLGTGAGRDSLGRFYTYYSESELTECLQSAGFTMGTTQKGSAKGLAGDVEPWIMINACVNESANPST